MSQLYIWATTHIFVSRELCIWAMSHELCVLTCACSSTRTHTNLRYMSRELCYMIHELCVPACACWSTQKQEQISSESRTLYISYKLRVLTCTCWPTKYIYIYISWALERRTAHTNLFLTFFFFLFPFFPHSLPLSLALFLYLSLSLSLSKYLRKLRITCVYIRTQCVTWSLVCFVVVGDIYIYTYTYMYV